MNSYRGTEKFFRLFLFNFLVGYEDDNLKNYSLIHLDGKNQLSPCYDLVNTTLTLEGGATEESALPLAGKKSQLNRQDVFLYLAKERLRLTDQVVAAIVSSFRAFLPRWQDLLWRSFLPEDHRRGYWDIVVQRYARVFE